ncbi:MAG: hypothetical protein RI949_1793 [Pseudomonadota bacterium]|jgi:hypothetical protein
MFWRTRQDQPAPRRPQRAVSLRAARRAAALGLVGVIALQALNSFGCAHQSLSQFGVSLLLISWPMAPALVFFWTSNPLRSLAASLSFAPWLVLAYAVDCVAPYSGGGASMIYVPVILLGFFTSLSGALVLPWLFKCFGWGMEVPASKR